VEGVGFGADENAITIIGPGDEEHAHPRASKDACAELILDAAAPLVGAGAEAART